MYGWRARLGLLVPSTNTTMESEWWRMVPVGVSVHTARMLKPVETNEEILIKMEEDHAEEAAAEVATANVDVIAFGCTTGSLVKGKGHDRQIADKIKALTSIPAVTTSTAVLSALRAFRITKVSLVTPYIDALNRKEVAFFEANGFHIVGVKSLELLHTSEIGRQESSVAYRMAKSLSATDCDGYFISCTNFRTIEVIEILEQELRKPVITSNQATLAASLNMAGVSLSSVSGYGSLFRIESQLENFAAGKAALD